MMLRLVTFISLLFINSVALRAQSMPDDSNLTQLVIIGQADSAPVRWFSNHPQLVEARKHMHFQVIEPGSQMYRQRYEAVIQGRPPMVLWQRSDGGVIYAAAGSSVPTSGEALFSEMKEAWRLASQAKTQQLEDCPDGNCDLYNRPYAVDEVPAPFQVEVNAKGGFLSRAATWIFLFVGGLFGLFVVLIGTIVLLAVLYFVSRLVRK